MVTEFIIGKRYRLKKKYIPRLQEVVDDPLVHSLSEGDPGWIGQMARSFIKFPIQKCIDIKDPSDIQRRKRWARVLFENPYQKHVWSYDPKQFDCCDEIKKPEELPEYTFEDFKEIEF